MAQDETQTAVESQTTQIAVEREEQPIKEKGDQISPPTTTIDREDNTKEIVDEDNDNTVIELKPQQKQIAEQQPDNPKEKKENINPPITRTTKQIKKRKKNDKTIDKLLEGFKYDMTVEEACAYAGIHKDTYYDWLKQDKELSDEVEKAKHFSFTVAKKTINKALSTNPDITLKRLSKRQPKIYADKQEVEHTGTVSLHALYVKAEEETQILDVSTPEALVVHPKEGESPQS